MVQVLILERYHIEAQPLWICIYLPECNVHDYLYNFL